MLLIIITQRVAVFYYCPHSALKIQSVKSKKIQAKLSLYQSTSTYAIINICLS